MTKKSFILGTSTLAIAATTSLAAAEVNQPQEVVMRPLTTPAGQITAGGDLGIHLPAAEGADTSIGLGINARYGVNEKLEVGASYGLTFSPEFSAENTLLGEAAFSIMEGNLSVAVNAVAGYDIEGERIAPLQLGARVRFRLNEQLAITTGSGGGLSGLVLPGITPQGGQLSITIDGGDEVAGVEPPKPIVLSLPVGVAYQASPNLYAFVNTNIANIGISDADGVDGFIFADFIPLQVGATFSPSNTMDLGASIGWLDLGDAADDIFLFGHARLHL